VTITIKAECHICGWYFVNYDNRSYPDVVRKMDEHMETEHPNYD
jgi:hypothetical protein